MSDHRGPSYYLRHVQVGPYSVPVSVCEREQDAVPLVMFHGIAAEYQRWGRIRDSLQRTTLAFDVRAEHLGRRPSIRTYAEFVTRVIAALELPQVDVLGLSWGGILAQQLVHDHPAVVRRMVLASTSPGFLSVPSRPASWIALMSPKRDIERMPEVIKRLYGGDFLTNPGLAEDLGLIRQVDEETYRQQLLAIFGWTSVPWLASIRNKTLILHADNDPLVPFVNSTILRRLLRESHLRKVSGGGHLFLLTRPEEFARVVGDFLGRPDFAPHNRLGVDPDEDGLGDSRDRVTR